MKRKPPARSRQDRGEVKTQNKTYRTQASGDSSLASANVDWNETTDDNLWHTIQARVKWIRQRQTLRRYEQAIFQNLYCNYGDPWASALFNPGSGGTRFSSLSINIIKSCVDTGSARIAKDKPRVFVLPSDGDAAMNRRALNATKYLDGAFAGGGFYEASEEMFRDAEIYGDGAYWIHERDGEIVADVLKADELVIDEINGIRNAPTEMFIERSTSKRELLAKHPEYKEQIQAATRSWRGEQGYMGQQSMVRVIYAWMMPTSVGANDGKWAKIIEGVTLDCGDYDKSYIPIQRFQWTPPTYGPFGMGMAHELQGMQASITLLAKNIMQSIYLFACPRVWVEKSSGVSQHAIGNGISVNQYTGTKPVFESPPAASPDIYQFLQWMIDAAYKQLGLSQLTAQSEKPDGLNSGVGLRNYQDIETQRFSIAGQRWERTFVSAAEIVLDMSADLYEKDGKLAVDVPGRDFVETIEWKSLGMRKAKYELQVFPTALLPRTPEGQFQTVQELITSGLMPRDVALGQLRMPNVNGWIAEETASRDNIELCLARIRDKDEYRAPNGIANIDLCVTLSMSAWLRADMDPSVNPSVAEKLLRFLNASLEIQASRQAAANPPMPPGPPGPPPGAPPSGPPGGPGHNAIGVAPPPPPAPLAPSGVRAPITMPQAA